jgi:quercetin dioxygenase-like cupin family protein
MKTAHLLEGLEFHDRKPNAEPLHRDKESRAYRFMLKPGQQVSEHNAPDSPVHLVVLKGHGLFAGGDGEEQQFGPNTLLIFDPGENHAIRASDEELVFLVILHGASSWQ